jgi:hypothetical protein
MTSCTSYLLCGSKKMQVLALVLMCLWGRVAYTSPAGVVNVVFSAEATPWVHPRLGLAESEIKEAISWLMIWI